jgi:hypothetical protein
VKWNQDYEDDFTEPALLEQNTIIDIFEYS